MHSKLQSLFNEVKQYVENIWNEILASAVTFMSFVYFTIHNRNGVVKNQAHFTSVNIITSPHTLCNTANVSNAS